MAEKAEKAGGQPVLTARETELLTLALQCLKDPKGLQVDYKKLMTLAGFKSPASATASWLGIKKKLIGAGAQPGESSVTNAGDEDTPAKAKPAPKKRAVKVKAEVEADAPADDEQTPVNTPKQKGGAKRKAPAAKASKTNDNDNDNDGAAGIATDATAAAAAADGDENAEDPTASTPKKNAGTKRKAAATITSYAEDDAATPAAEDNSAANDDEEAADGPPAKKKRNYTRKPKDANAPAAPKGKKAAAKKGAKGIKAENELELEPLHFGNYGTDTEDEELYVPQPLPPWSEYHPNNGCGPGWEPWNNPPPLPL